MDIYVLQHPVKHNLYFYLKCRCYLLLLTDLCMITQIHNQIWMYLHVLFTTAFSKSFNLVGFVTTPSPILRLRIALSRWPSGLDVRMERLQSLIRFPVTTLFVLILLTASPHFIRRRVGNTITPVLRGHTSTWNICWNLCTTLWIQSTRIGIHRGSSSILHWHTVCKPPLWLYRSVSRALGLWFKGLWWSSLCATFFSFYKNRLLACTSLQLKTHIQNNWSVTNQIEYLCLR